MPGRNPFDHVEPPSVEVAQPMFVDPPPPKKRPAWNAATRVEPAAATSGSTSVACSLPPPVYGSELS